MKDIKDLTELELLGLKAKIDEQLSVIRRKEVDEIIWKDTIKYKTKLSELDKGDIIFGIGMSSNNMKVIAMDYCDVRGMSYDNKDYYSVSVGHKTKPFGCTTSISKDEANKPYVLFTDCSVAYFFTLKPQNWEEDIKEALKYSIKMQEKRFDIESQKLRDKIDVFFKDKQEIDDYIFLHC